MRSGAHKTGKRVKKTEIAVERSSGNVFEDLGLADSDELLFKSDIVSRIASIIERRSLTQTATAKLLGVSQGDVSDLVRGKLRGFSTDRLFRFLNALGQDVEISMPRRLRSSRGILRVIAVKRVPATAAVRGKR